MALPVAALEASQPPTVNWDVVDAAYRRADGILRAYQMRHLMQRHRLARESVEAARQAEPAPQDLERAVAAILQRRIAEWLEEIARQAGIAFTDHPQERLRLTLWMSQLCQRWPECFLQTEVPAAVLNDLKAFQVHLNPRIDRSSLGPSLLQFGAAESVANTTRGAFQRWPVLRVLSFYLSLGLFGILVYWLAR